MQEPLAMVDHRAERVDTVHRIILKRAGLQWGPVPLPQDANPLGRPRREWNVLSVQSQNELAVHLRDTDGRGRQRQTRADSSHSHEPTRAAVFSHWIAAHPPPQPRAVEAQPGQLRTESRFAIPRQWRFRRSHLVCPSVFRKMHFRPPGSFPAEYPRGRYAGARVLLPL